MLIFANEHKIYHLALFQGHFHFDNWPWLIGTAKQTCISSCDTLVQQPVNVIYQLLLLIQTFLDSTEINIVMSGFVTVNFKVFI